VFEKEGKKLLKKVSLRHWCHALKREVFVPESTLLLQKSQTLP
jgi:hypothetical protein